MPFDTQTHPVVTTSAADMLGAMSHLIRALDKRTGVPELAGAHMSYADGVLTIRATDIDIEVVASLDAMAHGGEWQALVDAVTLHKVLQKTKGKADVVALSPIEDGGADVTVGKTRIALDPAGRVDHYPMPISHDFTACDAPAWRATLANVFTRPAFAISTEEARYYLGGLYLHQPDDSRAPNGIRRELRAVATDGHRMAHMDCGIELPPMPAGQIVPRKAVDIIGKALTAKGAPDAARIAFSKTRCRVTCGNIQITTKAVDGTFPDYTRIIPERAACWRMDRAEALDALNASLVMASDKSRTVKLTLSHDTSEIECSGNNGSARQHLSAIASAATEDCASGFNAAYLGDVFKAFKDADEVVYSQARGDGPARFEVGGDPLLVVVMPARL